MNARTGYKGGGLDEEGKEKRRRSKDEVINKEEEELVNRMRKLGLCILNGNVEGDREEDLTYIGGMGCSVIDYGIVNEEGRRRVKSIREHDRLESDHSAVIIEIEVKREEEGRKE